MSDDSISVERQGSRRLLVWMSGTIDDDDVDRLRSQLLDPAPKAGTTLLMDLVELEACSTATRARLMELQRDIFGAGVRTAYVAQRPRFRGVCMWIAHEAEDTVARVYASREQAEMWLSQSVGRLESLYEQLTSKLRSRRGGDTRESPSRRMRALRRLTTDEGNDDEPDPAPEPDPNDEDLNEGDSEQ